MKKINLFKKVFIAGIAVLVFTLGNPVAGFFTNSNTGGAVAGEKEEVVRFEDYVSYLENSGYKVYDIWVDEVGNVIAKTPDGLIIVIVKEGKITGLEDIPSN